MLISRSVTLNTNQTCIEWMLKHTFRGLHLFISRSGQEKMAMWVVWFSPCGVAFVAWTSCSEVSWNSFAEAFDAGHCQRQDMRPDDAHDPSWKCFSFLYFREELIFKSVYKCKLQECIFVLKLSCWESLYPFFTCQVSCQIENFSLQDSRALQAPHAAQAGGKSSAWGVWDVTNCCWGKTEPSAQD